MLTFFPRRNFDDEAKETLDKSDFKWVFDFEYSSEPIEDASVKYQYNVHPKAADYETDRAQLDTFLKDQNHIIFSDYTAG